MPSIETTTKYKYFDVTPCPQAPGRKTRTYEITNRHNGNIIGLIEWYSPWRQYCFCAEPWSVWNAGCLRDVQDFLGKLRGN